MACRSGGRAGTWPAALAIARPRALNPLQTPIGSFWKPSDGWLPTRAALRPPVGP